MLMPLSDSKDLQIHDQSRKIQNLEETCQDLEGTIVQFRELVLSLQTYEFSVLESFRL